jgi:hypothetical protein
MAPEIRSHFVGADSTFNKKYLYCHDQKNISIYILLRRENKGWYYGSPRNKFNHQWKRKSE